MQLGYPTVDPDGWTAERSRGGLVGAEDGFKQWVYDVDDAFKAIFRIKVIERHLNTIFFYLVVNRNFMWRWQKNVPRYIMQPLT